MTSVTDQDTPALNDTSLSTASVQNAPQQGTHRSNDTSNNIDESASFPPSTSTTFKTSITRQTTDMNATAANSALDSEEDDSGDNEDKGSELLGDDFELPTIDDPFEFDDGLEEVHSIVTQFLQQQPLHDRMLSERKRRQILRSYPQAKEFSARPPVADHAFVSLAHRNTIVRDKQLANLSVLQLQAIRPLLLTWSDLLNTPDRVSNQQIIAAIRATLELSIHAAASTTHLRRKWIMTDVNPNLVHTLRPPALSLFGPTVTARLQEADNVAAVALRMASRQSGNQRSNQASRDNYRRPNDQRPNSNNRYRNSPSNNQTFRSNNYIRNRNSNAFPNRNPSSNNQSNSRAQPSNSGSGQNV